MKTLSLGHGVHQSALSITPTEYTLSMQFEQVENYESTEHLVNAQLCSEPTPLYQSVMCCGCKWLGKRGVHLRPVGIKMILILSLTKLLDLPALIRTRPLQDVFEMLLAQWITSDIAEIIFNNLLSALVSIVELCGCLK
ncbi:hypothetical protein VM1G_11411 [Cytospora mali]|uniref:Uncharacterized protein n=1 Tax=Cytospora mali TaxID=578113 RepID=A0A194VQ20_CYTMA|nr:hypothetical protein VM1G_11411 [Valsa mali]